MTKDELKQEAERLGVKVRESFMDDLPENMIVLAIGLLLGAALTKMFF
jgi:hypothetical protein